MTTFEHLGLFNDLIIFQAEIHDHQTFETEVGASQERVQAVVAEGNRLLQEGRCVSGAENVSKTFQ